MRHWPQYLNGSTMRGTKLLIASRFSRATLSLVMISIGFVSPAAATANAKQPKGPSWMQCYDLGMARGVHVEQGELPAWMDVCLAGKIPFESGQSVAAAPSR